MTRRDMSEHCCRVVVQGEEKNLQAAQQALLKRAKANSMAQLGKYDPSLESADAGERTFEKVRTPIHSLSGLNIFVVSDS